MLNPGLIKKILKTELPNRKAHVKLLPKGRKLELPNHPKKEIRKSAVLVLLIHENDEIKLCLTRRASTLKNHAGQISFAGGTFDAQDQTTEHTALRETHEEIGIQSSEISVLGQLSELYVSVSNFNIIPIVGWMNNLPEFKVNHHEVDEIIILPLKEFFKENAFTSTLISTSKGEFEVPCYLIQNHIIWGATGMMIAELVAALKPHC